MKLYFWPVTKAGKWAVGSMVLMPVLFLVGFWVVGALYPGVAAGNSIQEDLRVRPLLAVPMLLGMFLGLTAFLLSNIAIWRKQERSVTTVIAWLVGLWLIVMLVGETVAGH